MRNFFLEDSIYSSNSNIIIIGGLEFIDYKNDFLSKIVEDESFECKFINVDEEDNLDLLNKILRITKNHEKIDEIIIELFEQFIREINEFKKIVFNKKDNKRLVIVTNIFHRMQLIDLSIFSNTEAKISVDNSEKILDRILNAKEEYFKLFREIREKKYKQIKFISSVSLFNNFDEYENYVLNKYNFDFLLISYKFLDVLYYNAIFGIYDKNSNLSIINLVFE